MLIKIEIESQMPEDILHNLKKLYSFQNSITILVRLNLSSQIVDLRFWLQYFQNQCVER